MSAADVVTSALDALRARDWAAFARRLHPDVVHRTPGVPEPILGRDAFLLLSQQAVARTPDVTFEVERLVSQGETVVVIGEPQAGKFTGTRAPGESAPAVGQCGRPEGRNDLARPGVRGPSDLNEKTRAIVIQQPQAPAAAQFKDLVQAVATI